MENHLRKSQVVLFTGEAKAERKIIILHSDFCILHFYKSPFKSLISLAPRMFTKAKTMQIF